MSKLATTPVNGTLWPARSCGPGTAVIGASATVAVDWPVGGGGSPSLTVVRMVKLPGRVYVSEPVTPRVPLLPPTKPKSRGDPSPQSIRARYADDVRVRSASVKVAT